MPSKIIQPNVASRLGLIQTFSLAQTSLCHRMTDTINNVNYNLPVQLLP